MLVELKLCSHAAPGSESVSSLGTRTKEPLLKEALVPSLGKAQLGFVVAGQAFSWPHFGPNFLDRGLK